MTDFSALLQPDRGQPARTLHVVTPESYPGWLGRQSPRVRTIVAAHGLEGKPGNAAVLPGEAADDWSALLVCNEPQTSPWRIASRGAALPPGTYRLADGDPGAGALGWMLAQHRFGRYRTVEEAGPRVLLTGDVAGIDHHVRLATATAFVRDLVDTPASDCGPAELEAQADALARRHGATLTVTRGDELAQGYPLIHAVGRAATRARAPRLIELTWGNPQHPRVALIGKGVCFDTGGLDIKPSSGMLIMKKDMGGAANVLALAMMVMDARLPVRLRVLIPAVENAVAGNAFRPLDIFTSRKGPTVEIGNTDAEGRLVLADALAYADEDKPDILIDMGTLTGAARVALGPDLPPFYTNDETLAGDVMSYAAQENDPVWRLPLWAPYDSWLDSKVADINNAPSGGFAGSITCALFLQRFVQPTTRWLHLDIYGWTPSAKPGRPEGGECQAARAIYRLLGQRYG